MNLAIDPDALGNLLRRVESRNYTIGIVGMGYVGLPLALAALRSGFRVIGFDIDQARVSLLNRGESGFSHIPGRALEVALAEQRFRATDDLSEMSEPDAILIAVPTPLTKQREPDLSYVESSTKAVAQVLRPGQLVVLESTTWPGTTREVMQPLLEAGGLRAGRDFYLAFSPEREDPGNARFATDAIPKVVGGDDPDSLKLACALYDALVVSVVPVSTAATAEAVKLTENIFRSVNIALVNELKVIYDKMGIDVWEVIDAAKTKPFGFTAFYPGPGLGGHCIPIDPFYLAWKSREYGVPTRFIELAGEINTSMPDYVVAKVADALDRRTGRGLNGARILIVGLAYKKNIADTRESPSLKLIDLLEGRGAVADYHDPHLPSVPRTRAYGSLQGRQSVALDAKKISEYDAVVIATDHDDVDWTLISEQARLLIDTRNVFASKGLGSSKVVKA